MSYSWDNIMDEETFKRKPLPEGVEIIRLVGVSFVPEYPKNIHALQGLFNDPARTGALVLRLVHNPYNEYDSNAVEVRFGTQMLGHLPKEVAARIAPKLDNGDSRLATVYQVQVNPEKPQNPGLDIQIEWLPK